MRLLTRTRIVSAVSWREKPCNSRMAQLDGLRRLASFCSITLSCSMSYMYLPYANRTMTIGMPCLTAVST
eukprot:6214708-Pleurochrysis_carterae.AAC.1